MRIFRILWLFSAITVLALPAFGQSSVIGIGQEGDWVIYKTSSDPLECGIMSLPIKMVHQRDGRDVRVNRGNIRLAISILKNKPGTELVSYQSGFPIKESSTVQASIDGTVFELYLDPSGNESEWAWPGNADDLRIVAALKRGNEVVLTSTSQRGTVVKDTFSLTGVTKGLRTASEACSN